MDDTFERHKAEITTSLEPVEEQLGIINEALEHLSLRSHEVKEQRAAIEASIVQQIQLLIDILQARKVELIGELDQIFHLKMKNLGAQKDDLETVHTHLASCLQFITDSLRRGSNEEVMKMKKGVIKQVKEMTDNIKLDMLPPCESANIKFMPTLLTQASQLQQFGKAYLQQPSPEKCYAKSGDS